MHFKKKKLCINFHISLYQNKPIFCFHEISEVPLYNQNAFEHKMSQSYTAIWTIFQVTDMPFSMPSSADSSVVRQLPHRALTVF